MSSTGVQLGVMAREPVKCVVTLTCKCGWTTRRLMMAHVGREVRAKCKCDQCGAQVLAHTVPKELDS